MAFAFRRGTRAMAVTSSTTAVAFMANIFSPIMPIRGFGIYSGIIVPVNFLLVVMILPPAVIWYERYIEGYWIKVYLTIFFCCNKNKTNKKNADLEEFE
jgi:predicted RND superfamily exporter protein